MSGRFRVLPLGLNLRREPIVAAHTKMAVLHAGQQVQRLAGDSTAYWWQISAEVGGTSLTGWVASDYLEPVQASPSAPDSFTALRAVHLSEGPQTTRAVDGRRAFPLGEPGIPRRNATTHAGKVEDLGRIIQALDVENSARYLPDGGTTYCNIYAYDYCYLARVYLPRVWWKASAIADLVRGREVQPRYGETLQELNANALTDWLEEFGPAFGWARVFEAAELQDAANQGHVCVIAAQRTDLNRSGHICAAVPETSQEKALTSSGVLTRPLQSQAGRDNFQYGTPHWWTRDVFRKFGFWTHE